MPLTASEIQQALPLWGAVDGGSAQLINVSENQTFLIEALNGARLILRVHRVGYQTRAAIESELAWIAALGAETDLPISEAVAGRDGQVLQSFVAGDGLPRLAVLFHYIPGREPRIDDDLTGVFRTLGVYAATMHSHSLAWPRPAGFERPVLNAAAILDADGSWGDWRVAPGVDAEARAVLLRLDVALRQRLALYGTAPERFGLIHGDMRLGNLLVDGERLALIDFDDSGISWFAYDFAASISFHETSSVVPALRAAWLEGYRTARDFGEEDVAAIDAMVMLRRMALLAWMGSHHDTKLAQTHVDCYADGTVALAERFLNGPLWP